MIPSPDLTTRIVREVALVLAFRPWLSRPGIRLRTTGPVTLYYVWSEAEQQPYIEVPAGWDTDDVALRRIIRHEMGHLWSDALCRRVGGSYTPYADLAVDPADPLANEVVAEIFARTMGELPTYGNLKDKSEPTPARIAFVEHAGSMPPTTAEKIDLDRTVAAFWARPDIPDFFRTWAGNYQRWLDLYVLGPLKLR